MHNSVSVRNPEGRPWSPGSFPFPSISITTTIITEVNKVKPNNPRITSEANGVALTYSSRSTYAAETNILTMSTCSATYCGPASCLELQARRSGKNHHELLATTKVTETKLLSEIYRCSF